MTYGERDQLNAQRALTRALTEHTAAMREYVAALNQDSEPEPEPEPEPEIHPGQQLLDDMYKNAEALTSEPEPEPRPKPAKRPRFDVRVDASYWIEADSVEEAEDAIRRALRIAEWSNQAINNNRYGLNWTTIKGGTSDPRDELYARLEELGIDPVIMAQYIEDNLGYKDHLCKWAHKSITEGLRSDDEDTPLVERIELAFDRMIDFHRRYIDANQ